tara:strand:+ start:3248 stop:3529 length:282 start_codon:yes stop_codon:yes gene_type:complete
LKDKMETSSPIVKGVFMVQTNRAPIVKKAPHQIMMFATYADAQNALDKIRKLRQITPKFGGHKLVKRTLKIDNGMFDVWCITERVIKNGSKPN